MSKLKNTVILGFFFYLLLFSSDRVGVWEMDRRWNLFHSENHFQLGYKVRRRKQKIVVVGGGKGIWKIQGKVAAKKLSSSTLYPNFLIINSLETLLRSLSNHPLNQFLINTGSFPPFLRRRKGFSRNWCRVKFMFRKPFVR